MRPLGEKSPLPNWRSVEGVNHSESAAAFSGGGFGVKTPNVLEVAMKRSSFDQWHMEDWF